MFCYRYLACSHSYLVAFLIYSLFLGVSPVIANHHNDLTFVPSGNMPIFSKLDQFDSQGMVILAQAKHYPPIDHGTLAPRIDHEALAPRIDHDALGPKVDHEGQKFGFQPGAPALPGIVSLPPLPLIGHGSLAPPFDHDALRGDFQHGSQSGAVTSSDLSKEELAILLDALRRYARGDHASLQDILKYNEEIPRGVNYFVRGNVGIGVGPVGAGIKVDLLSVGMKLKKNHDGSVLIEVAGQLGVTPGIGAFVGASAGGGFRAKRYIKISSNGQTLTFGRQIGAGGGAEGIVQTPGVGVFGRLGVDVSAMVGYELEMSVKQYSQLTPKQISDILKPHHAAYLAFANENIGLYVRMLARESESVDWGGHAGGAFGLHFGFKAGTVNYESENFSTERRLRILWRLQPGQTEDTVIVTLTIHLENSEVSA